MRVKAIAEVNEQGIGEQAIGPREKRRFVEQDEVVDASEAFRSGLPAGWLSLWFLGNT